MSKELDLDALARLVDSGDLTPDEVRVARRLMDRERERRIEERLTVEAKPIGGCIVLHEDGTWTLFPDPEATPG